jgi:hypothetical protein
MFRKLSWGNVFMYISQEFCGVGTNVEICQLIINALKGFYTFVHESNARLSCTNNNWQKCYVFLIIVYFYCSMELEKRTEQVQPGRERSGRERVGVEAGGRNDPNNICTCE